MVTIARLRQAMQGRPWFTVCRTAANVHSEGSRLCRMRFIAAGNQIRRERRACRKKRAAYVSTPVDRILKKDRLDSTRITHLHCFHINGTFISPQTQQRTGVDYGR
jgi:hypothetical protein